MPEENRDYLWSKARFTLQKMFGTAQVKMARFPKKGFGSDEFAVKTTSPYQISSMLNQNFYPCWDLRLSSPSIGENGTGAGKNGTVRIEQVV